MYIHIMYIQSTDIVKFDQVVRDPRDRARPIRTAQKASNPSPHPERVLPKVNSENRKDRMFCVSPI